jgi:hypothetical protein
MCYTDRQIKDRHPPFYEGATNPSLCFADLRSLSYLHPDLLLDAHSRSNDQENFAYHPAHVTRQRLQVHTAALSRRARRQCPKTRPGHGIHIPIVLHDAAVTTKMGVSFSPVMMSRRAAATEQCGPRRRPALRRGILRTQVTRASEEKHGRAP